MNGRPLIVAGTASGVGKTTVATGLMGALRRRGLKVAPFKVGPDYIDPGYHESVTGAKCRNLDTWLTSPGTVQDIFSRGSAGADVSIIEGVMGLFDGRAGAGDGGSTAEVAGLVDAAAILVVDCRRQARSLAPVLAGFASFTEGRLDLAGAILNGVGSAGHERMLRDAAREAGVEVLGVLPRRKDIVMPSRHLGLVPAAEREELAACLERMIDHVGENVDVEALLTIAGVDRRQGGGSGERGDVQRKALALDASTREIIPRKTSRVKIAVAYDEAFSFYYVDSLEALEEAGAELVCFSPLKDSALPCCDGLYLGGGFPEMFAETLEVNLDMRGSIFAAAAEGLPVYAECGGLIYLCEKVEIEGKLRGMTGVVPLTARMSARRQALGYVEAETKTDSIIASAGTCLRGHEFHWSAVEWDPENIAFAVSSSRDKVIGDAGFCKDNVLASYLHLHFAGNPDAAARFVDACARGSLEGVSAGAF